MRIKESSLTEIERSAIQTQLSELSSDQKVIELELTTMTIQLRKNSNHLADLAHSIINQRESIKETHKQIQNIEEEIVRRRLKKPSLSSPVNKAELINETRKALEGIFALPQLNELENEKQQLIKKSDLLNRNFKTLEQKHDSLETSQELFKSNKNESLDALKRSLMW
jgi:cell division protein FtsB